MNAKKAKKIRRLSREIVGTEGLAEMTAFSAKMVYSDLKRDYKGTPKPKRNDRVKDYEQTAINNQNHR